MSDKALSYKKERHLVLDYLLGFSLRYLVDEYGVPRQTIYRVLERHKVKAERRPR